MPAKVLVVEDDRKTAEIVADYLRHEGHEVVVEHAGDRASARLDREAFDLLVLDLMLPGVDGLTLCKKAREREGTAVILLTARTREEEKVAGLGLGADDYVTKPFSAPELLARVRASLRRNVRGTERIATLRIGATDVDLEHRTATNPAGAVHLTPLEYRVLECLVRHSGKIVRAGQLLREAWGPDKSGDTRTLRVCMKNLRDKLEPDPRRPQFLVTETGLGYRLRL